MLELDTSLCRGLLLLLTVCAVLFALFCVTPTAKPWSSTDTIAVWALPGIL